VRSGLNPLFIVRPARCRDLCRGPPILVGNNDRPWLRPASARPHTWPL